MNARAVNILENYDLEVLRTAKVRGAILCEAKEGIFVLREYQGQPSKIGFQKALLSHICHNGFQQVEDIYPNKEQELFTTDMDGTVYIVKTFFSGRECNVRNREECLIAMGTLGRLHKAMNPDSKSWQEIKAEEKNIWTDEIEISVSSGIGYEFEKRNKELKKVRRFLREKSQKTYFEIFLLEKYDRFFEQALAVTEKYKEKQAGTNRKQEICHGDYQYHNVLFLNDKQEAVINFEKCLIDDTMRDLYLFLRKIMEKQDWSTSYAKQLLEEYHKERKLQSDDIDQLYYRFSYPEKFWKIVNFYYNAGKAWIPGRNTDKLEKLLIQEDGKARFLEEVFS